MKKIIRLLLCSFFFNIFIITAQEAPTSSSAEATEVSEESEDPELDAYRKEQQDYFNSGFEIYIHYPLSIHFPGWSYPEIDYDLWIIEFQLPGPNISWGGLGAGFEIDFGSRKKILKNMGFGSLTELSIISPINMMDGVDLALLLNYPYLYYTTRREKGLNFTFRAGMGIGIAINSEDLFIYPEEKDHPFGAVYALETAVIFPLKGFRFQAGMGYRFMTINSKDIHMFTPLLRAGYRF